MVDISKWRKPEHEVDKIFLNRWSPRAMSPETLGDDELMSLFEAAKWAPSSFNNQPWRFAYAKRNTQHWTTFYNLLTESNQVWCKTAAVLIVIISKNTFDLNNRPARTHSFDAGSAWGNLALQGSIKGLVVHGMQGFDYEKAKIKLGVPDGYTVEAMAAIGKAGRRESLPEYLQKKEFPSNRKKINETVFEGKFRVS
jgi:nitroreductase